MSSSPTPVLDSRDASLVVAELTALQPAFTPELQPNTQGPAWALAQIFGRYVQNVVERLNQAPDKNQLAFLDLLGVNLLPPQASRAPLVFQAITGTGDSRIPAQTSAGASLPGSSNPLVFQTEQAIALASAPLVELVSVIPADDSFASHSAALARGEAFTLFEPEQPIAHQFYLAHDIFLALSGVSAVHVQFELSTPGNDPLPILWEFWNGQVWQGFESFDPSDDPSASFDGTAGLTRSGIVRLLSSAGTAATTPIAGVDSYWIRGTLTAPLPPDACQTPALAQRVQVSCNISRPLRFGQIRTVQDPSGTLVPVTGCIGDILPDNAYSDGASLDVSKSFFPLGRNPDRNSAFYFSSAEVFEKAGAKVTVSIRHGLTPEQQADQLAQAELAGDAANDIMSAAAGLISVLRFLGDKVLLTIVPPWNAFDISVALSLLDGAIADAKSISDLPKIVSALNVFADAMSRLDSVDDMDWSYLYDWLTKAAALVPPILTPLKDLGGQVTNANLPTVVTAIQNTCLVLSAVAAGMLNDTSWPNGGMGDLASAIQAMDAAVSAFTDFTTFDTLNQTVSPVTSALANTGGAFNVDISGFYVAIIQIVNAVGQALNPLVNLSNTPGFGTVDTTAPTLDPPQLIWEYWDGGVWQRLLGPADDDALNFVATGNVQFVVPAGMAPTTIQRNTGLWMRVRIDSGSYQVLRVMTWKDPTSGTVNTMGILEQRPPVMEAFYLGYQFNSPRATPNCALTFNDFQYVDHTADAVGPGSPFAPYQPTSDQTPTLYLGFDGALPADLLGLYFALPAPSVTPTPVAVTWEGFDGDSWVALTVDDETTGLVSPGIVSAVWPGMPAPSSALVTQAKGTQATVTDPRQAAAFRLGQRLYIAQNGAGELVTLSSVANTVLTFSTALSTQYSNATIAVAVMPRFGTPRSWIRGRMQQAADPPHSLVNGLYPNAVWASQLQTNQNETLGSSNGGPDQIFFLRQTPVLAGEIIEVCELTGARAAVELPMLRQDLANHGMTDADLRIVTDPVSGQITQVWVQWQIKPNLLFSGPDDRDATLERTTGQLSFGDGVNGKIPPAGQDNVFANTYESGGGLVGNVPAGAISQLLSGVTAQSVTNPRMAEAGADGETMPQVLDRGPQVMRHRYRSTSRLDYEALAQEASPGVAVARAWPTVNAQGRPAPGWVSLVIVPQSSDPQPQPSLDLRNLVQTYITARAPAALEGLAVIGPTYLLVGVTIAISPLDPSNAGTVGSAVQAALAVFLHPLTGGPDGTGWPFGRSVYLSDIASLVESIDGVDYASSIDLLVNDTPVGDVAAIPDNRMVAAGNLRVILGGVEV